MSVAVAHTSLFYGTPFPSMYLHLFIFIFNEDQSYLNREDVRWDKMLYLIQNIIIEMGPISITTKLIDILRTGIIGILHTPQSSVPEARGLAS